MQQKKKEKTVGEHWRETLPPGYSFHPQDHSRGGSAPTAAQMTVLFIVFVLPIIIYFLIEIFKHSK